MKWGAKARLFYILIPVLKHGAIHEIYISIFLIFIHLSNVIIMHHFLDDDFRIL
jgi:hypothetical protein